MPVNKTDSGAACLNIEGDIYVLYVLLYYASYNKYKFILIFRQLPLTLLP